MCRQVRHQATSVGEPLRADRTAEGPLPGVNAIVRLEVALLVVGLWALGALVRRLACMGAQVIGEVAGDGEGLRADRALVRPLPGMSPNVLRQVA